MLIVDLVPRGRQALSHTGGHSTGDEAAGARMSPEGTAVTTGSQDRLGEVITDRLFRQQVHACQQLPVEE